MLRRNCLRLSLSEDSAAERAVRVEAPVLIVIVVRRLGAQGENASVVVETIARRKAASKERRLCTLVEIMLNLKVSTCTCTGTVDN